MFSNLLKRIFGIPAEENLVWGLINKQGNPKGQLLAFLGFMGILTLAYWHPVPALAFIVAMYGHEWGHWLIFTIKGIVAHVWLLFPMGAVAAPKDKAEDARSDQLPWWDIAWMLQAGPAMNFVMMLIGFIFLSAGIWPTFGRELILINGMLGAFNLLPLGNLDGGQFFHVIYSSLKERYDVIVAIVATLLSIAMILVLFNSPLGLGFIGGFFGLFTKWGYSVFLVSFAAGIWHKQGKDNPLHSKSLQAMTVKQVIIQVVFYIILTAATLYGLTLL